MGKKYIIELEDKPLCVFDKETHTYFPMLYRVKGFNSLVFDEEGLKKLTPADSVLTCGDVDTIESKAFERGAAYAWEIAQRFDRLDGEQFEECFGIPYFEGCLATMDYRNVKHDIDGYEARKYSGRIAILNRIREETGHSYKLDEFNELVKEYGKAD